MEISLNVVDDSNDKNNLLHKLFLTKTQVWKLCKAFANISSANIKLSHSQLHKIGQSGEFLGRLLEPLLKTGLPLKIKILKPLPKTVLIPLGLIAAASGTDTAIHKKMFGSCNTSLIVSNEEINNIMKITKSLEESGLVIKGVNQTVKSEAKE